MFPGRRLRRVESTCKVTTRKSISGKHVGTLLGAEATGENISIDAIDIVRIRDGQYIEHWGVNTLAADFISSAAENGEIVELSL